MIQIPHIKMFSKKLISCFNKCCPVAEIKVRRNTNKPWLTKGLINACRKKNHLYKRQLQTKHNDDVSRYLTYKNKLTSILCKAEKQYYSNKLFECKKL